MITLIEIDKNRYRKHLNIAIACFVASLLILALAFGALFIATVAEPVAAGQQADNFRYNLLGVILALLVCSLVLYALRKTSWMAEIVYVWRLKQVHNQIYRRLVKIKQRAGQFDENALMILNFYYASLRQVYLLDDNTLTISKLDLDSENLQTLLRQRQLSTEIAPFDPNVITLY